jgi:hypothetical protein
LKTNEQIVVELGHSADDRSTAGERIARYRALASTTASEAIAGHFFRCADELKATEAKIGQLALDFGNPPQS